MAYTFAQFKTDCNEVLWPNGVPENMVTAINRFYVEAMVDVQRYAKCYRNRNETVFPQSATMFKCGTTVFDAPKGRITKVYVVDGESYCQPVTYAPVALPEVSCWSRRFTEIVTSPENTGLTLPPLGYRYPESTTDSVYGRALYGKWSIDSRGSGPRIILAPWIQSTEKVVVEWSGIKYDWDDADLVVEDDHMLSRAIRSYVRWMYESLYVCDRMSTAQCRSEYDEALSELIYECKKETEQPKPEVCDNEVRSLFDTFVSPTESATDSTNVETTVIAAFGDYGVDNSDELAVANLVKSWGPAAILALGDNNYETGSASTIDENVGKYFSDYIYPYLGSYDSDATANKFWPVLGNHDLDTSNGQPYLDYFPTPVNQRFYDVVIGNVHVFALNSGIQTDGDLVETAGNDPSSAQAQWLYSRMLKSTAKWKIVILHHPPYTNGSSYSPGRTELRWPFETWGADAVLNGHSHVYERIEKGATKFKYLTVGTGGKALDSFIASPVDQKYAYNTKHGALKISATCAALKFEFYNVDGELIDDGSSSSAYVPPASTYAVYWGRSVSSVLTGAEIAALSNSSTVSSFAGNYAYLAGSGYLYFAVPDSKNPASIKLGAFDVPLAGSAEGYAQGSGVMTYTLVTVGSTSYRLYRTFNTVAGATTLAIA